jgi:hypothetical protein
MWGKQRYSSYVTVHTFGNTILAMSDLFPIFITPQLPFARMFSYNAYWQLSVSEKLNRD